MVGDDGFLVITPRAWIPEISYEQLAPHLKRIKQVMYNEHNGALCYVEPTDSEILLGPSDINYYLSEPAIGLIRRLSMTTFHRADREDLIYLPDSTEETISQLLWTSPHIIDQIVAFELEIELKQDPYATLSGYKTAVAWFYTKPEITH